MPETNGEVSSEDLKAVFSVASNRKISAEKIQELLSGTPTIPIPEIKGQTKVFISYTEKPENEKLICLSKKFLRSLGFIPKTWRDSSGSSLQNEIDRLIHECPILIAFITKDIQEQETKLFYPSGNIPGEIESARFLNHKVIRFYEKGTTIPSNISSYYCNPFINELENYAELFIDLIKALRKEGLLSYLL